jgi:GntR family transcriptional regulator/MocR family aminotransferase
VFALARAGGAVDPQAPQWAKKAHFLMSMLDDGLSEVTTTVDLASCRLTVGRHEATLLEADLETGEGRASVEAFFQAQIPGLGAAPRLVRARGGHFMDKPDNLISLINLATLRSLEAQWGCVLDPLRFRANLYIDGVEPWAEFGWVGGELRIGAATFRVDRRNGRCGATNVDPVTGRRDLDIPGALRRDFGHKDLGVYLSALQDGEIAVGDAVEAPAEVAPAVETETPRGRLRCRGCYFVYDEIAPGAFAALADDWKCPDCGAGKEAFRPQA